MGGKINADFIDNSAGVNTSDREVNLKILLDAVVSTGDLTRGVRDELLAAATDEVATRVLHDSRSQARAISVVEAHAPLALDRHAQLISNLEELTGLDRDPRRPSYRTRAGRAARTRRRPHPPRNRGAARALQEHHPRRTAPLRRTRPARAVGRAPHLLPASVLTHTERHVAEHPLAREIIATSLANDLVNHVGPGFAYRVEELTGAGTPDAVLAYIAVRRIFDLDQLWTAIDHLDDRVPTATQLDMHKHINDLIESEALWLLHHRDLPIQIDDEVERFRSRMPDIAEAFAAGATPRLVADVIGHGVPADVTRRVEQCVALASGFDLLEV